jgi:hypothetical protein
MNENDNEMKIKSRVKNQRIRPAEGKEVKEGKNDGRDMI